MNMFDEARAMSGTLLLCKITQRELAERMGVSQSYIANKLRLLSLSPEMQARIIEHGVSERHARILLTLGTEEDRCDLLQKVIAHGLSVRECEAFADVKRTEASHKRIVGTGRGDGITAFCTAVGEGVRTLVSLGIDARSRTSHANGKMYITVCISDT